MDYLTVAANAARSQAEANRLNAAIEGFRQRTQTTLADLVAGTLADSVP